MTDLLFQTPWWLPTLIAAAGVVIFVTGNARTETRVRTAGLAAVCLAILLAVVSYFVDTPRETAEKRSRELCYAFEQADWTKMTSILDKSTAVTVLNSTVYASRDQIVPRRPNRLAGILSVTYRAVALAGSTPPSSSVR